MDVVIDTSVVMAVLLNEPIKSSLVERTAGVTLLAPLPVHWEIGNAFSAMLKRKRISLPQVRQALHAYERIPIRFIEVDLKQAVELADQLNIYAYDAYLLAAALRQKSPLLTLDGGLAHAARQIGVVVMEVDG